MLSFKGASACCQWIGKSRLRAHSPSPEWFVSSQEQSYITQVLEPRSEHSTTSTDGLLCVSYSRPRHRGQERRVGLGLARGEECWLARAKPAYCSTVDPSGRIGIKRQASGRVWKGRRREEVAKQFGGCRVYWRCGQASSIQEPRIEKQRGQLASSGVQASRVGVPAGLLGIG